MLNDRLIPEHSQHRPEPHSFSSSLFIYLYVGHFLARWSARMWEFSVGLYMINVWPDSLLLAATYGVVESASTALFGPLIGQWVDKMTYVKVIRVWSLSQNISFVVAGGSVIALLMFEDLITRNFIAFLLLIIFINVSGAVGALSTLSGTILIEREWIVVISEGQASGMLTKMNSVIRRIDLVCKLLAPVASGFIISFVSLSASAMALVIWNIVSVFLQYWLLMSVYNGIPALSESSKKRLVKHEHDHEPEPRPTDTDEITLLQHEINTHGWLRRMVQRVSEAPYVMAWKVYLEQDVLLPGISLSFLFFTILSFGTLMTAVLEWEGIPAYIIGIARGISAVVGIGATFLYPVLESRISTIRTGLWSIWSQWTCLLVCLASIWAPNKISAAYMLMAGVAASRLGLWMFDLSVIQQMQDHVPESNRIIVGGVQNSLQSILDLTTYIMGIIISNPKDFWKLIIMSFGVVSMAGVMYTIHVYRVRKHLFHFYPFAQKVQ